MNNDPNNHPLPGNFLGTIYKGGFIVPVIQTLLLTVIALSIERYIAIGAAFGKGSLVKFVANIKAALAEGDMKKGTTNLRFTTWFCSQCGKCHFEEVCRDGE